MVRWHKPSCTTPLVVVNETTKTPHCTSCSSSPNLHELAAAVAGFSPLPPLPPDEPLDDLNLHWPATVKYTYPDGHPLAIPTDDRVVDTTSRPTSPDGTIPITANKSAASKPQAEDAEAKALIPYERSLRPDEFRLLRLPFAEPDDPVHITLEICHNDDYPEYETCSYSWGGEDGDSTLCKPVFVGEYWDILFQTRNCWEMLKCLRPAIRGAQRVLWVDALCINQRDPYGEREEQVKKMFQIYRKADRVVVFLGKDMFGDLGSRGYPKRRQLSQMPKKTDDRGEIGLIDLLGRHYFRRLWVVQELLVSRRAVIRVRDTEYWIDSTDGVDKPKVEGARECAGWRWEATPAPWFQYAAKGHLIRDLRKETCGELLEIMMATEESLAADPRDKVFGVLALTQANATYEHSIRADYSLSLRHVMIGTLAHSLVVDNDTRFLWAASGLHGWGEYPSWAPPWRTQRLFKDGIMVSEKTDLSADFNFNLWQTGGVVSLKQWARCDFADILGLPHARWLKIRHTPAPPDFYAPPTRRKALVIAVEQPSLFFRVKPVESLLTFFGSPHPAPPNILGICGRTGALCIKLMHMCQLNARPRVVDRIQSNILYTVGDSFLFMSDVEDLENLIEREHDHMFTLDRGAGAPMFFILRATSYDRWQFRVVASCCQVFIKLSKTPKMEKGATYLLSKFERSLSEAIASWTTPSVTEWDQLYFENFSPSWWKLRHLFIIFPDKLGRYPSSTAAILSTYLYSRNGSDEELKEEYIKAMDMIHGQGSVVTCYDGRVEMIEVKTRHLRRACEGWNATFSNHWPGNMLFNRTPMSDVLPSDQFIWTDAFGLVEPVSSYSDPGSSGILEEDCVNPVRDYSVNEGSISEGQPGVGITGDEARYSDPWGEVKIVDEYQKLNRRKTWEIRIWFEVSHSSRTRPFALRAPKDLLLGALREALQGVDIFSGRLNGKDGSCWKMWKQENVAYDAPVPMKLGPVNAPDLTWPDIEYGDRVLGNIEEGGLVFDGMTYNVEVV